jgi:hypothetical protein
MRITREELDEAVARIEEKLQRHQEAFTELQVIAMAMGLQLERNGLMGNQATWQKLVAQARAEHDQFAAAERDGTSNET